MRESVSYRSKLVIFARWDNLSERGRHNNFTVPAIVSPSFVIRLYPYFSPPHFFESPLHINNIASKRRSGFRIKNYGDNHPWVSSILLLTLFSSRFLSHHVFSSPSRYSLSFSVFTILPITRPFEFTIQPRRILRYKFLSLATGFSVLPLSILWHASYPRQFVVCDFYSRPMVNTWT